MNVEEMLLVYEAGIVANNIDLIQDTIVETNLRNFLFLDGVQATIDARKAEMAE